jgi:hypothetical protein
LLQADFIGGQQKDLSPFITVLRPQSRVSEPKAEAENWYQQIKEQPIYFDIRLPRHFNRAAVKLIYQNTISGMKGMFALQPYTKVKQNYTQKENRNLWEYELVLSEYERKLIYYHVWELKDINMKYYFTSYNCSTVIYNILSLANPKIYNDKKIWITPLDSVKFLYKYNLGFARESIL